MMFRCEGWALCKKNRVNSLGLRRRLLQIHQKQWLKNQPFVTRRNQARMLTASTKQNKPLYFDIKTDASAEKMIMLGKVGGTRGGQITISHRNAMKFTAYTPYGKLCRSTKCIVYFSNYILQNSSLSGK